MAKLMKQTEEPHSESRMRAIRTSRSIGRAHREVNGPRASHPAWVSLLYSIAGSELNIAQFTLPNLPVHSQSQEFVK